MPSRYIVEGVIECNLVEDGGTFEEWYIHDWIMPGLTIVLHSFSEDRVHTSLRKLQGRKIKVTLDAE